MLPSMLLGADEAAESPVAPGVMGPFALSILEAVKPCPGARVLSKWVDEEADSFVEESGFVGFLRANNVAPSDPVLRISI